MNFSKWIIFFLLVLRMHYCAHYWAEGLWNGSSIFANALGLKFWGRFPVLLLLLLFVWGG